MYWRILKRGTLANCDQTIWLEPDSEVSALIEEFARGRSMIRIMASLMKATAVAARAS
jgi:hypothetical protein